MAVNTEHDTAWEDIQLVIQSVEKKALEAKSRTDILFYNYATLEQGKHVVHMGVGSTDGVQKAREGANQADWDGDMIELMGMFDNKKPKKDEDGNDLPWTGSAADVAGKYLKECFGCSFRIAFDYQLNPLSLITPLLDAARTINASVKRIEEALDPIKNLEELCSFMEQLKIFCPQDLATLMMSLKMLLKSYALKGFNLKLDWTVILGPILKAIAELLIAIVDAIMNLALAPIDCALGALRTAEQLERAGRGLAGAAANFGKGFGASADTLERNVQVKGAPPGDPTQRKQYGLGSFVGNTAPGKASDSKAIGTGFAVRVGEPMDKAIKDPAWANATVMQKAVVAVGTARQQLVNLFDNLKLTLDSLSQLVSGGLALSLDMGAILLTLFDFIGMVMMIIRMFHKVGPAGAKAVNWCEYLAENPDELRDQLERQLGGRVQLASRLAPLPGVASADVISYSVVVNGKALGEIPLCVSSRNPETKAFMDRWIQELGSNS